MQDFLDKLKASFDEFKKSLGGKNKTPAVATTTNEKYELNLVPEVKLKMIKAQKLRNLVLFGCIVVSAVAIGVVAILFSIKSGQDITMAVQDGKLEKMSEKLASFTELDELVTLQGQLDKISDVTARRKMLSRVFGAVKAMMPQGGDSVKLSELRVDMTENQLKMEAQADALTEPLIDYRVLEAFKKSASLAKYDYGRYVDMRGEEIPSRCMKETDDDGNVYMQGGDIYAWWDLTVDGCAAVKQGEYNLADAPYYYSKDAEVELGEPSPDGQEANKYEGMPVRVKVWRTPQFNTWHDAGKMSLDGSISEVEHFNSSCYTYTGIDVAGTVKWTSQNECMLADGELEVTESNNARNESDNLVLRFAAKLKLEEEFFKFSNKHMLAISPTGQNVTDSYVQIQGMFTAEARDCAVDDEECLNASNNRSGGKEE